MPCHLISRAGKKFAGVLVGCVWYKWGVCSVYVWGGTVCGEFWCKKLAVIGASQRGGLTFASWSIEMSRNR